MAQLLETGAGSSQVISARAADSGHTWTRVIGSDPQTLAANGGVIRGVGNDTKVYLSSFTPAGDDWDAEIDFDFRSNVGGLLIGCIVCGNTAGTAGFQVALNGFSDQLTFTDVAPDTAESSPVAWTEADHTVRFERRGDTLTITISASTVATIDCTGYGNRFLLYAYSETLDTDFYAINRFMAEDAASDDVAPENTVAPAVTGTPRIGQTLSCSDGTWTGTPEPSYSFQWQRDTGSGFGDISGATGDTYELVDDDLAADIRCVVTADNDVEPNGTANSNEVGPVVSLLASVRLSGGASNTDPAASIGGAESSEEYTGSTSAGGLFDDSPHSEYSDGHVDYRCVYVHNDDSVDCTVTAYVSQQLEAGRAIALAVADEASGVTVETIADDTTAPSGPSFSAPTSAGTGLDMGTIDAGEGRGLWLRRTTNSGTAADATNAWEIGLEITPA